MVVAVIESGRAAKRARRSNRISAHLYDFFAFPDDAQGEPPLAPFRDGVRSFLSSHARLTFPPSTLFSSLVTWQILLRVGESTNSTDRSLRLISLDVVEEDVTRSSRSLYCDHCRVVGWSEHPVCRKRYHFIIRSGESKSLNNGLQKSCSRCGNTQHSSDGGSCNVEDWVYSQLDDQTHVLHAVIHSNGYAHLLSLNGREGGSPFISGCDLMHFWDRLCKALAVRQVSVMDVSRKYGIDYRLLHAIITGHSWYGRWGYEFKSGSYALTRDAYQNAVRTLSAMPISHFLFQRRKLGNQLHSAVAFYQFLSSSQLLTLKDIFSFLLRLIHEIRASSLSKTPLKLASASNRPCAWSKSDVERVQAAMIKLLKAVGGQRANWVTSRALKGSLCRAASPELLDYCLKYLGGMLADDGTRAVRSWCNPASNDLEFRLETAGPMHRPCNMDANYPLEEHVKRDLRHLYDSLLHPQTMAKFRSQATRDKMMDAATKILDCKHFIKECKPTANNPCAINLWCNVELSDQPKECPAPPPELLVLPMNATVADLKSEAAKAFQEVYAMFKRFEVEELLGYGSLDDSLTLKFLVGTSGTILVKGRCSSKHGLLRYRMERGMENWRVDCMCGTKDDDGEKMLACDACGVWHHTRCAGMENSDALSFRFHCFRCIDSYNKKSKHSDANHVSNQVSQTGFVCRGESAAMGGGGSNLSVTLSVG